MALTSLSDLLSAYQSDPRCIQAATDLAQAKARLNLNGLVGSSAAFAVQ